MNEPTNSARTALIKSISESQIEELEKLSAVGYTPKQMALYFGVDEHDFVYEALDINSRLNYHIARGALISVAKENLALLGDAEKGNVVASQRLGQIRRDRGFEVSKLDIFGGFDDEKQLHKLQDYIANGSRDKISNNEALYLEMLSQMHAMDRQFGRRNTISFFTKPPFNLTFAKARDMYDEAQNIFYSDRNVEKQAMRHKMAEQIEEAARQVFVNAKSSQDYERYGNMIVQAAKLQELDKPDANILPRKCYIKPVYVFVLTPETVGIPAINRQQVAAQIDALDIPEMDKIAKRRDAMVEDVPFEEMLDEQQAQN